MGPNLQCLEKEAILSIHPYGNGSCSCSSEVELPVKNTEGKS